MEALSLNVLRALTCSSVCVICLWHLLCHIRYASPLFNRLFTNFLSHQQQITFIINLYVWHLWVIKLLSGESSRCTTESPRMDFISVCHALHAVIVTRLYNTTVASYSEVLMCFCGTVLLLLTKTIFKKQIQNKTEIIEYFMKYLKT